MTKLEEYKVENMYSSSEDVFYIDEQPSDTCPMIDSVIKEINSAIYEVERIEEDYDADIYWAKKHLSDLESELEDIREHVEKIRAWGQQWKDLAKRLVELDVVKIEDVT